MKRHHDRGEGTGRQRGSDGSRGKMSSRPRCSARNRCGLLTGLVGEPVLVAGLGAFANRVATAGNGNSCGLPNVKSEISGSSRRVAYRDDESLHGRECRIRGPYTRR